MDVKLLSQVLRRPMWLAGLAVMLAGEVLHVLALAWTRLAVVQPIGVATGSVRRSGRGSRAPRPTGPAFADAR